METPASFLAGAPNLFRQRPTLPPTQSGSTIGAEGLNFRVRNGIGCIPLAKATGNLDSPPICVALLRQPPHPLLAAYLSVRLSRDSSASSHCSHLSAEYIQVVN
jgi:hypothetical protein